MKSKDSGDIKDKSENKVKSKGSIHLIRHGQTEGNINRLYYGASDIPLTDVGIFELEENCERDIYPPAKGARLFTTGMYRTEQTFAVIYGGQRGFDVKPVEEPEHDILDGMKEYDFGDYELKTHDELKDFKEYRSWIGDASGETCPPGGESPANFQRRVWKEFESLLESFDGDNIIVICHGGVISTIMTRFFTPDEPNIYKWQPDPGRGYTLLVENGEVVAYEEI